jgi:hypothetical protein
VTVTLPAGVGDGLPVGEGLALGLEPSLGDMLVEPDRDAEPAEVGNCRSRVGVAAEVGAELAADPVADADADAVGDLGGSGVSDGLGAEVVDAAVAVGVAAGPSEDVADASFDAFEDPEAPEAPEAGRISAASRTLAPVRVLVVVPDGAPVEVPSSSEQSVPLLPSGTQPKSTA